jgi:hypothetical protein
MVVGLSHERPSFRLSRQSSDASCLSLSVIDEEDDATDIKPEILSMKRSRKPGVTFDIETQIIPISSHKNLTEEEKRGMFMSGEELFSIRLHLRALVIQTEADRQSGSENALEENDEKLRGLEVYISPGKQESATRKGNAFSAVFENQKEGFDGEKIAAEYAKISVEALEQARKLAMMDQERAWSADELEQSTHAPTNQTMDR